MYGKQNIQEEKNSVYLFWRKSQKHFHPISSLDFDLIQVETSQENLFF